jgi:predicted O-methyltransferase YrrM
MVTLDNPTVERVLSHLFAETRADESFMAVASEVGRLCYLLVRTYRPSIIVELGTSFGLSTIRLALWHGPG